MKEENKKTEEFSTEEKIELLEKISESLTEEQPYVCHQSRWVLKSWEMPENEYNTYLNAVFPEFNPWIQEVGKKYYKNFEEAWVYSPSQRLSLKDKKKEIREFIERFKK